ncbi:S41 family peptidase [Hymenobacter endophyticus]|uniref:S41 family peptidase n=1 Tax=Hymenobacter endophyticus TaxID=3076335 RepID=A0ABU3TFA2_9BACT|nr:S41 family peptidase [Hymenobacter endophyticus]MDU0370038.1 S41 family peptidase [Hymenobacter endophyticus]
MKNIFLMIFFGLLSTEPLFAQNTKPTSAAIIADDIATIIRKNSLFSDSLNWPILIEEARNISIKINTPEDTKLIYDFFTDKLREKGDNHSFFITGNQIAKITTQSDALQPQGRYLGNGIGYIKVPACFNFDKDKDRKFANNIRLEIKKIDTENTIASWIVDLRQNTGGNMWPMLAGLNALTKDGVAGYFVTPQGKRSWKVENGIAWGAGTIDKYKIKNPNARIVVLIDSLTGSSGEMTAISFSGLPNVKFFGTQSAGYTTANSGFKLSNGDQLYLATGAAADRNHKIFTGKITPDFLVKLGNDGEDTVLDKALQWLR